MHDNKNRCRARDCRDPIAPQHIMCKFHWSLVTHITRGKLLTAWQQDRHSQRCHELIHDARKEVADYLAARETGWSVPHAV